MRQLEAEGRPSGAGLLRINDEERPSLMASLREGNKLNEHLLELRVAIDSESADKQVLDLGLPEGVLLVLLNRQGSIIVPNGGTIMRAGDEVVLLVPQVHQANIRTLFEAKAN